MEKGWSERLSTFAGSQLIDYPYTFATSSVRYLSFGNGSFEQRLDNWYKIGFQMANAQFIMNGTIDAGMYSVQKQFELSRINKRYSTIYNEINGGNTNWFNEFKGPMLEPVFPEIPHFNLLPYTNPGQLIQTTY